MKKILIIITILSIISSSSCGILRPFGGADGGPEVESAQDMPSVALPVPEIQTDIPAGTSELPDPAGGEPVSISFIAAGDAIVHPCIYIDARNRAVAGGREYNFKPMFGETAPLFETADIAFINQETLMAGQSFGYSGYPLFNSPQDLGHDLVELGFDIVNIANNHMIDKGAAGLEATINFWRTLPVELIGDFLGADELDEIPVIERDGVKIALLSYTYGTNGISLPKSSVLVIPYIDDALIERQLSLAREAAEVVIVSVHWGNENVFKPTDEQKRLAKLMADGGADVIIGHHPHVLQPIEWIDRADGGKTLCAYSLGNLFSGMAHPMNMVGGLLNFDIVKSTGGEIAIENPLFTPTMFYYGSNWLDSHIYLLSEYPEELCGGHGAYTINGNRHTLAGLRKYVTDTITEEFLAA